MQQQQHKGPDYEKQTQKVILPLHLTSLVTQIILCISLAARKPQFSALQLLKRSNIHEESERVRARER